LPDTVATSGVGAVERDERDLRDLRDLRGAAVVLAGGVGTSPGSNRRWSGRSVTVRDPEQAVVVENPRPEVESYVNLRLRLTE